MVKKSKPAPCTCGFCQPKKSIWRDFFGTPQSKILINGKTYTHQKNTKQKEQAYLSIYNMYSQVRRFFL